MVHIISSSVEPPPAQSGEYLISIQIPILVCVCVGGGTFEAAEGALVCSENLNILHLIYCHSSPSPSPHIFTYVLYTLYVLIKHTYEFKPSTKEEVT